MKCKDIKEKKVTTIMLLKETVKLLKAIGKKTETYDDLIRRLIKQNNEQNSQKQTNI